MPKVARCGTRTDHGAEICTCSSLVFCDGIGIAAVGYEVCPHIHQQNPIATGSEITFIDDDDKPIARVGDRCQCGAVIVEEGTCAVTYSD